MFAIIYKMLEELISRLLLLLTFKDVMCFEIIKLECNINNEELENIIEDWFYKNDFDCVVLYDDEENKKNPSIIIDCTYHLRERDKVKKCAEEIFKKLEIEYKFGW